MKIKKYIYLLKTKKFDAFTMIELLVVMAIIGTLSALAVPKFLPLISKSKTMEAKVQLGQVLNLEKGYFYTSSKYTTSFSELGFEQSTLVTADGNANYKIDITDASTKNFTARATAVVDFDGDGQFNVWQINADEKLTEVTPD